MTGRYTGAPTPRVEDPRLLTGHGRYIADIRLPGMLEVVFVRSPIAHGRLRAVAVADARAAPGVVAVVTAADLDFVKPFTRQVDGHHHPEVVARSNLELAPYHAHVLARDKVVRAGEPVAAVVATDRYLAEDAAELVDADIEPLPVIDSPERALEPGAPLLHDRVPGNVYTRMAVTAGDPDGAIGAAPHRLAATFRFGRSIGSPIETRGVVVDPDPHRRRLVVWANTQQAYQVRRCIAEMLDLDEGDVRVVTPDIGGSFGGSIYPEEIVMAALGLELGRPLRWLEDRLENLSNARHSRDQQHSVEVGFDEHGRVLALKDSFTIDAGAYNSFSVTLPYNTLAHMRGQFKIDHFRCEARAVATNKLPATPVRGAGRSEAVFVMDRVVDMVAEELGLDPALVRRRNLIPADEMPYHMGMLYRDGSELAYDSGDFPEQFDMLLEEVGYEEFRQEQQACLEQGRYIGIGFSSHVEGSGIGPFESARIRLEPSGGVAVSSGATTHGQSHATVLAQICADVLGVPIESVTVRTGDTALVARGVGTYASRGAVTAGSAVYLTAQRLRERILAAAAGLLDVDAGELDIVGGQVVVKGDATVRASLGEVASAAARPAAGAGPAGAVLEEEGEFVPPSVTFASGSHAAVVEVDPETGGVTVLRYVVVDECGRALNPMVVDGQQHGGVAHGIGNALLEEAVYDSEGQLVTGTFIDYLLPTAPDLPAIEVHHQEYPSPLNPIGVKGTGEGATASAPAAIANAVVDALRPLGVRVAELPISPAKLRGLIAAAPPR